MKHAFRVACLVLSLSLLSCWPARAATTWTQPTPDELKMTTDPKAPNAPAVYLNLDEYMDVKSHFWRLYARVKILNDKGKEMFSNVEIPYEGRIQAVRAIEGRTVHSDGTVVPFTGQAYDKELVKAGDVHVMAKTFAMPDVQVGSIVEYRLEVQYDDGWTFWPHWDLQQRVFAHEEHYHYTPMPMDNAVGSLMWLVPDGKGHFVPATRLVYDSSLPPGAKVQDLPGGFDLVVHDVPAIPEEPYSPPLNSFSYRLYFFLTGTYSAQEFWNNSADYWSQQVDKFAGLSGWCASLSSNCPSDRIKAALAQIGVASGDSDDAKAHKIYAAVMQIENIRFTRVHSQQEIRSEGQKEKTAADIWDQKRGEPNEITRLFIALTRTAGLKTQAMIVPRRDVRVLNPNYLSWTQLTDEIAVVSIGGRDVYFDPGERWCDYGKLAWEHTQVMGFRQTDKGAHPELTPAQDYKDTVVRRTASLQLGPDGSVQGTIQYSMTGAVALRWRQLAARTDADEVKRQFDDELRQRVPAGVQVKTDHFDALTDNTQPLVATVQVTGSMGTVTGKRVFLSGTFFEANVKPEFPEENRENPVDLHYPYAVQDVVKIVLAPGLTLESIPQNAQIPFPQNAQYVAKYLQSGNTYQQGRLLAVGNTLYKKDDYPQLRDFFQKVSAQDQQQVVLERTATAAAPAGDAGKSE